MAEWSKALALGASPRGRGFEPHCYHEITRGFILFVLVCCAGFLVTPLAIMRFHLVSLLRVSTVGFFRRRKGVGSDLGSYIYALRCHHHLACSAAASAAV